MCIDFVMPYLFQQGFELVTDLIETQDVDMLTSEIDQWTEMLTGQLAECHLFDIDLMQKVLDLIRKTSNNHYQENIKQQVCIHAFIIDDLLC